MDGETGPQGPIGMTGPAGANGMDGATGPQGPAGADGQGGITTGGTNVNITGIGTSRDPYVVNAREVDGSVTNEIQNLTVSMTGDTLTINGGNSVIVPGISLANFPAQVGDFRHGGVVFWVDPTDNTKGMVVDVVDISAAITWGCTGVEISGADGSAIGTGAQNTIDIEAGCLALSTPADFCSNSTVGGFTDWFFPSIDEVEQIYNNRGIIAVTSIANGGTAFGANIYWSSTELDANIAAAYRFDFAGVTSNNKSTQYGVRCVRAF